MHTPGLLSITLACFAASGCCRGNVDVTHDARFHGDYVPGRLYRLTQDAILTKSLRRQALVPSGPEPLTGRTSKGGVVRAGTRLRIAQVLLVGSSNPPPRGCVYLIEPTADILDGAFAGKRADIYPLSRRDWGRPVPPHLNDRPVYRGWLMPDPAFLAPAVEGPPF